MRRPKVFLQDRSMMTTCGVCCAMMALNAFGIGYPSRGQEKQIYDRLSSKQQPGTTAAAVAYYLSAKGLDVSLRYSSKHLIDNFGWYYTPAEYQAEMENTQDYLAREGHPFEIQAGVAVNPDTIRSELRKDRMVIAQVFIEGDADGRHRQVPHAILIYDLEDDVFLCIDPLSGRISMRENELESLLAAPIGRMMMSVGEKADKRPETPK